MATSTMGWVCPVKEAPSRRDVAVSQSRAVLSSPAVTRIFPSPLYASAWMAVPWPDPSPGRPMGAPDGRRVATSHCWTTPLLSPVASVLPSGLNASA